jgi:hypothetical protein
MRKPCSCKGGASGSLFRERRAYVIDASRTGCRSGCDVAGSCLVATQVLDSCPDHRRLPGKPRNREPAAHTLVGRGARAAKLEFSRNEQSRKPEAGHGGTRRIFSTGSLESPHGGQHHLGFPDCPAKNRLAPCPNTECRLGLDRHSVRQLGANSEQPSGAAIRRQAGRFSGCRIRHGHARAHPSCDGRYLSGRGARPDASPRIAGNAGTDPLPYGALP